MPNIFTIKGLSIERLRTFCAVIEAGSMVDAAGGDPTLQSQYSRQIRDLQKALGVELFTQEGKFKRPTPAGKKLAALTNGYFAALDALHAEAEGKTISVRVGAGESVLRWMVLPSLPEILGTTFQGNVEFLNLRTLDVVERLKTGRLDIGIIRENAVDDPLVSMPFGSLEYILIVPRILLPGKSAAGIHHLKRLPLATLTGEGEFVRSVNELGPHNGIHFDIRLRVPSFSLIVEAIRTSEIAAFVPKSAQDEFPEDRFAAVDLTGTDRLGRALCVVFEPNAARRDDVKQLATKLSRRN